MCTQSKTPPERYPEEITREREIPEAVKEHIAKMPTGGPSTAYFGFLEPYHDTLLCRVFGVNKTKSRGTEATEVIREAIGEPCMFMRRIYYEGMAGWRVWHFELTEEESDENNWWHRYAAEKLPGIWIKTVNPEAILEHPRFRYSGWRPGLTIRDYLRKYLQEPGVEFFGKAGVEPKTALINKAKKDGAFRKFLRSLTPEQAAAANLAGPTAVMQAYKDGRRDFATVRHEQERERSERRELAHMGAGPLIEAEGKQRAPEQVKKIMAYIRENVAKHGGVPAYCDYIRACVYLQQDLTDTKVAFPRDFRRLHDMRINQMHSQQAKADKARKKQQAQRFAAAAQELKWTEAAGEVYAVIIPERPEDLVREGAKLHHCVGKMGYDVKMIEKQSFIAFIRKIGEEKRPFVTVEYNLQTKAVQQCYGARDSRPAEAVREFVDTWARTVTETLKKQEREARAKAAATA